MAGVISRKEVPISRNLEKKTINRLRGWMFTQRTVFYVSVCRARTARLDRERGQRRRPHDQSALREVERRRPHPATTLGRENSK